VKVSRIREFLTGLDDDDEVGFTICVDGEDYSIRDETHVRMEGLDVEVRHPELDKLVEELRAERDRASAEEEEVRDLKEMSEVMFDLFAQDAGVTRQDIELACRHWDRKQALLRLRSK
jgi:uncharacterized protein YjiS (DUF1127 family)